LYRSPNILRVNKSRRLRWVGHVARKEEGRSAFKILTGTPTGKRSLGRPRLRWEDHIRIYLKEIGINTRNWVDSTQDRDYWKALVNAALILRISEAMDLVIIYLFTYTPSLLSVLLEFFSFSIIHLIQSKCFYALDFKEFDN
jgi:hypothetical protein